VLAHGEKLHTQSLTHSITHPAYLMPRKPKHLRFGTGQSEMTAHSKIKLSCRLL